MLSCQLAEPRLSNHYRVETSADAGAPPLSFGELLKKHRLAAGISQEQLAERALLSAKTIGALEQGVRQKPYPHTIANLARALGLSESARIELERARQRRTPLAPKPPAVFTLGSVPNNLPEQLSSFVGRERDVAAVSEFIATYRLVTLVGSGGIGKTRLALHVAAGLRDVPADGVWFVDFAPLTNASLVCDTIAAALAVQGTALHAYLKHKQLLLILDNCEHLIDTVAQAAEGILRHCAGVRILATSREALRLSGERTYRVPSLDIPEAGTIQSLEVDDALTYGAVALFADRAAATDQRFELTAELLPTVVEICRQLDGIALAIELAAARVNVLSPVTLEQSLRERFLLLTGGNRTVLPRHKTMRALIDWSYELLDEKERRFLRMLSIFADGFTQELVTLFCEQTGAIVKEDSFELLASLVDKSLVQVEQVADETERYRLLDSTRHYALEKLKESGEYAAVARAYVCALLALSQRFDYVMELKPDRVWRSLTAVGVGNWRAAMEWALEARGDVRTGQELAASRGVSWFGQTPGESRHWVREALQSCNEETPLTLRAKLELTVSRFATALGELESNAALEAGKRALLLYQDANDRLGVAEAQMYVGLSLVFRKRIDEGKSLLSAALEAARDNNAQWLIGMGTHALGIAYALDRDWNTARQLFREGLALFKSAQCDRYASQTASCLAEVEYSLGNFETAVHLCGEAAQLSRENRRWAVLVDVLCTKSQLLIALERFEEAREDAREALLRAREGAIPVYVAHALQGLAAIAALRGTRPHEAAGTLGFVDARMRECEYTRQDMSQQEYDKVLQALRKHLGSSLEELMEAGTHWSEDRAITEALKL